MVLFHRILPTFRKFSNRILLNLIVLPEIVTMESERFLKDFSEGL